ncbi:hypothetical protein DRH14_03100 [Candidatus Shapirobacteria bacterium]|nr:MAG: hypothetical protein DRH14_03100 [Candidatus Shapirobacteria bacterium]
MFKQFQLDWWTVWGFGAQFLFLSSFLVQWWKSEKKKESFLPIEFWYLRLLASLMLVIYVVVRKDIVFMVTLFLQMIIYSRNIVLYKKKND